MKRWGHYYVQQDRYAGSSYGPRILYIDDHYAAHLRGHFGVNLVPVTKCHIDNPRLP